MWQPVTAALDYGRWLTAAYSDTTLITQFDGNEPDWKVPAERHGGAPTSSSTLPSLVVRMWADADVREGHAVLEIGTGTGYSTALACERLGSGGVTSIEMDGRRLEQAASALHACGYTPTLAVADGLYGYWPEAPFDRIVAACSFRAVPPALVELVTVGDVAHLVDVVSGSAATLTPDGDGGREVREGGPVRLWEGVERVLDAYDAAGGPGPETFTLCVHEDGQHLRHPRLPCLSLPSP